MKKEKITEQAAEQMLLNAKRERAQKCQEKIEKILAESGCTILVELHHTPLTGTVSGWLVSAK